MIYVKKRIDRASIIQMAGELQLDQFNAIPFFHDYDWHMSTFDADVLVIYRPPEWLMLGKDDDLELMRDEAAKFVKNPVKKGKRLFRSAFRGRRSGGSNIEFHYYQCHYQGNGWQPWLLRRFNGIKE